MPYSPTVAVDTENNGVGLATKNLTDGKMKVKVYLFRIYCSFFKTALQIL